MSWTCAKNERGEVSTRHDKQKNVEEEQQSDCVKRNTGRRIAAKTEQALKVNERGGQRQQTKQK